MAEPRSLINVLLVSGGGFQGLAVLKGLLQAGNIRVVLADCYEENIGRYFAHRAYTVPRLAQRDKFVEALFDICRREDIQVVFPSTELELTLLAECKEALAARGVGVAVSSGEFLGTVGDKQRLYSFLKQEGLPGPDIVDITAPQLPFPLLGKPKSGWGGKGHLVLHSIEDLKLHPAAVLREHYVWQPWLGEFTEYSVDFAINLNGAISDFHARERVRVSGGFAVVASLRRDEDVLELAARFARKAAERGGMGVFNVQILRAKDRCFISDVNPRMGTSATFGYGVGVNLPEFVCATAGVEPGRMKDGAGGITMVRYLEELFVPERRLKGIRGLVFDLDDTLINQKRWILDKLRELHAKFEGQLPARAMFLERSLVIVEEGNRSRLIDALCACFGLNGDLRERLIEAYRSICPPAAQVFSDVWPFLDEVKRRGYKLAILTNNPPRSQRQKIAACGFDRCFDEIIYAAELNAEKPAPEGFREAAKRLKLSPEELIMVGDNLYGDIAGALDCGYRHGFFITRPGGFFNFDVEIFGELRRLQQKFTIVSGLGDILRHLKEEK